MACVFDGLALLIDAPGRTPTRNDYFSPTIPDWLPAAVSGVRAFVAIGAVELLWVATAWPNGGTAMVLVAIVLLLLSPRGDLAFLGAIAFALTAAVGIVIAAILEFAVLPAVETFPGLCAAIGCYLVPVGFAAARSRSPALTAVFGGMAVAAMRLLSLTNPMVYATDQFYNTALAIFVGCCIGPLAFRLLPPVSPALRTRRLLALSLRALRRMAISPPPRPARWERAMYDRLAALPEQAEPSRREWLLAALSVGCDINQLRQLVSPPGMSTELNAALAPLAEANSTLAIARLRQIDSRLEFAAGTEPDTDDLLRVRGRIAAIAELLAEHGAYFDSGAPA